MTLSRAANAARMRASRLAASTTDRVAARASNSARMREKRGSRTSRGPDTRPFITMDFETDPFNSDINQIIKPFYVHFYSKHFGIDFGIWNECSDDLLLAAYAYLKAIETPCLIYAHNGGRFDHKYLTFDGYVEGPVMFKGSGYMRACLRDTPHELRDSFHLLPVPLAKINKDQIDIKKCAASRRGKHKAEIIRYCRNDCVYLHEALEVSFREFGVELTIGQIARKTLKKFYPAIKDVGEEVDEALRVFMRGGDVNCPRGSGIFEGLIRYYDVNSMYPYVMKSYAHPIGSDYLWRHGGPNRCTFFLHIRCISHGVLPFTSLEDGRISKPNDDVIRDYFISIYEYKMALLHSKLSSVTIVQCVDNFTSSNFANWVDHFYDKRLAARAAGNKYEEANFKSLLVNGFGKFCQDPRRFLEHFVTVHNEDGTHNRPPKPPLHLKDHPRGLWKAGEVDERRRWRLSQGGDKCVIWERDPIFDVFYNVGTGASITGAARAILMNFLILAGDHVLYNDTDSVVTQDFSFDDELVDQSELGKLKLEMEETRFVTAGKKMYEIGGFVKSKGVKAQPGDMEKLVRGATLSYRNLAPTFDKFGEQSYITRKIKATT